MITDYKYVTNEIFPHGLGTRMFLLTNAIAYSIMENKEFIITPFSYESIPNEFSSKNIMTKSVNYIGDCKRWDSLLNLNLKKITDIDDGDLPYVLHLSHPSIENAKPKDNQHFVYNNIRTLRNEIKKFLILTNKDKSDVVNISVHIRRGDIIGLPNRFIGDSYYLNLIKVLEEFFKRKKVKYSIKIFTQRKGFNSKVFEGFTVIYDTDITDNESWVSMLHSDVLVGSNSAFSTSLGMLIDGTFIQPSKGNFIEMDDWLYGNELTIDNIEFMLGYGK